ncbi:hypothetical protein DCO58_08110 [Helicobacter saguini]|uniref:Uncharacterized protein n=1 Tax=Helicobacter saguini TaxID=1548018 RepID=A0A347VW35_9HELI|nr:hypothetical protein [Helicobacter saguini]MWV61709.1 hypothetical protein [Helicobacter saguini]MWV62183.1 hypothetical protein [Helicobacter saguini]MWV67143.1 hypothetical protein [Helicobacter saguini]MWV67619.1 hypothetical protein [Helicobacter saguini]MWV69495.1 hypothetical protein [Helicobacter saguini]
MKFFVTIYIHPMNSNIPHAFLGLTRKHPNELDKIDKELRDKKLKNKDFKDIDKVWYESLEISEFNDGFFGFAPVEIGKNH